MILWYQYFLAVYQLEPHTHSRDELAIMNLLLSPAWTLCRSQNSSSSNTNSNNLSHSSNKNSLMGLDTELEPEYLSIWVSKYLSTRLADYPSIRVSMTIWAFGFSNCCQPLVNVSFALWRGANKRLWANSRGEVRQFAATNSIIGNTSMP